MRPPIPEDYFRERVAERYDESAADMLDSAVVEPVVDVLVELARDSAALEGVEVPSEHGFAAVADSSSSRIARDASANALKQLAVREVPRGV